MLIRGASRDVEDTQGRKPIDLAEMVTSESIKNTLKQDLEEPKDLECLMLKTPLKLVTRSFRTPAIMWFLMIIVYKILLMYLFPRKYACIS